MSFLTPLLIIYLKTAKIITCRTKLGSISLCCISQRYKQQKIKICPQVVSTEPIGFTFVTGQWLA